MSNLRTRWAAIGAAVAVSVGAGGIGLANASIGSGERPVYTAYGPCRITDTRPTYAIGSKVGPFGPGETHTVEVWGTNGECSGVPNDVKAVELNVTAVGATQSTHFTFWDSGPRPNASSLNPAPGQPPTPNAVTVNLDSNGSFRVYNFQGNVDLIIDVVGIYQDHHHGDAYYTKSETDGYLADKANTSDVYGKGEVYSKDETGGAIDTHLGRFVHEMNIGDPPVVLAETGPLTFEMRCVNNGGDTRLSVRVTSSEGPWYVDNAPQAAGDTYVLGDATVGSPDYDFVSAPIVVPSAGLYVPSAGIAVYFNYPNADCAAVGVLLPSYMTN